jgi:class 3 adenylate cyclase
MYVKNSTLTLSDGKSSVTGRRVKIVALFCDLRGFSNWCDSVKIEQVESLMRTQFERVIQICTDHHHDFHKFLGDGFVLVWEESDETSIQACLAHAVDAAFDLHKKYWYLSQEIGYGLPSGYGIGISVGEAVLLQPETFLSELNEIDFVGYPLNCAARMQTLANAYGTVLCSGASDVIEADNRALLYDGVPAFTRVLLPPSQGALERAASMKGLRERDRSGFKYLVFDSARAKLWQVTGIP